MNSLLQHLRGLSVYGLNALEWIGVFFFVSMGIYMVMRARDIFSANKQVTAKPKTLKQTPRKAVRDDIKRLPGGEETVLVVDDDPAVLRAHTRLISKLGYNVQRALGGQEAIEYIRKNHADLIVLDLLMPGLDGIETFRAIRDINPYQRAIVLSGFAGPAMVNSIKTLGVNTYLVKPAEASILAQAIREEIDRA